MLSRGGVFMFRGANAEVTLQAFELYKIQCLVMSPAAHRPSSWTTTNAIPTHQGNVQLILSGGSFISRALADRVRSRICSNLVTFYGATEVHGIAAATAQAIEGTPGAVGYLLPWMTVEAVDQSGNAGAARTGGTAAGPRTVQHRGLPRVTQRRRATSSATAGSHPGDLGTVTADGMLVIGGREKSVSEPRRRQDQSRSWSSMCCPPRPGVADAAAFAVPNPAGYRRAVGGRGVARGCGSGLSK